MLRKLLLPKSKLLYLYKNKKLSSFEIAKVFQCSAGTVINRMKQFKIKSRHSGLRRVNISKYSLCSLYVKKGLSAKKIANMCHCEQTAILNRLKKYGIPLVNAKEKVIISKEKLANFYLHRKLSAYKIAKIFNCEAKTIYRYLKIYKIETRHLKYVNISSNLLKKLYLQEKLSLAKISKLYNCSPGTILKKMSEINLERRTLSEAGTKYFKKDFSGDDGLKSYMIGFRLGDLRVRKQGRLINIGCGTTKEEQVQLIKEIFGSYGPIWVGKKDKREAVHVECSLNKSFSFLLPKHKSIPRWILKNKSNFLNFLAGYTDAEGNIYISNKMAKFRIRTYDKDILRQISDKLTSFSVKNIFKLEREAHVSLNRVQNKDCWGITINVKLSVFKILSLLEPLLKHDKRKTDLIKALLNIKSRLIQNNYEKLLPYQYTSIR